MCLLQLLCVFSLVEKVTASQLNPISRHTAACLGACRSSSNRNINHRHHHHQQQHHTFSTTSRWSRGRGALLPSVGSIWQPRFWYLSLPWLLCCLWWVLLLSLFFSCTIYSSAIQLERRILTMLQWLHLPEAERWRPFFLFPFPFAAPSRWIKSALFHTFNCSNRLRWLQVDVYFSLQILKSLFFF